MSLREDRIVNYARHLAYYMEDSDEARFIPLDHGENNPIRCPIFWPRIIENTPMLRIVQKEKMRGAHGVIHSSFEKTYNIDLKLTEILMGRYGLSLGEAMVTAVSLCVNCRHALKRAEGLEAYVALDPHYSCFFCIPTEAMESPNSSPS